MRTYSGTGCRESRNDCKGLSVLRGGRTGAIRKNRHPDSSGSQEHSRKALWVKNTTLVLLGSRKILWDCAKRTFLNTRCDGWTEDYLYTIACRLKEDGANLGERIDRIDGKIFFRICVKA